LGGNGWELYLIDADGQNLTSLAPIEGILSAPAWSPDGLWIAYTSGNPTRNDKDIFVIDVSCAESGSSNCVFHFDTPGYRENGPTWSLYGDKLAAKALLEGFSPVTTEVVVYTFTDGGPVPTLDLLQVLTAGTDPVLSKAEGEGNLPAPAWSKEDDSWLTVLSRDADFNGDLFLIDTVTLDAFNLTNCPGCDNLGQPSWSPCNSLMVVSTRDPNNRKNRTNSTLAFLDIQYDSAGAPELPLSITYLPRKSEGDSYTDPDWKRGICAPLP
jgi:Tol biopolymer transport system component